MLTWTYTNNSMTQLEKTYHEGVCLSTDAKPILNNLLNGSKLLEMDTSTLYLWDDESRQWRKWGA